VKKEQEQEQEHTKAAQFKLVGKGGGEDEEVVKNWRRNNST
jgi:hypothetical protein